MEMFREEHPHATLDMKQLIEEFDVGFRNRSVNLHGILDHGGMVEKLIHLHEVLDECRGQSWQKDSFPTNFVENIARKLREKSVLILLDVNYESNYSLRNLGYLQVTGYKCLAVISPQNVFRPFFRYRISKQLERFFPKQNWKVNMVTASEIEHLITHGVTKQLEVFCDELESISKIFPDREEINTIVGNAVDAISHQRYVERVAYEQNLSDVSKRRIGTIDSMPYICHRETLLKYMKRQLVDQTITTLAERASKNVTDCIGESVKYKAMVTVSKFALLRYLILENTFQDRIRVVIRETILSLIFDVFGFLKEVIIGVFTSMYTLFVGVDVNSKEWRSKVAYEIFKRMLDEKTNIKKQCSDALNSILESLRNELKECLKDIQKLRRIHCQNLESCSHEVFSHDDFEKTKELKLQAEKYRKTGKYLESTACVCINGLVDGENEVSSESEIIVALHQGKRSATNEYDKRSQAIETVTPKTTASNMRTKIDGSEQLEEDKDSLEGRTEMRFRMSDSERKVKTESETEKENSPAEYNKPFQMTDVKIPVLSFSLERKRKELIEIRRFKKKEHRYVSQRTYEKISMELNEEIIQSLLKNHSNIVAVDICTTKSRDDGAHIEPCICIVIFCFAKGFVPIGENLFPKEIIGYPTDVRESYALTLGTRDYNNPIGPGCSIGLEGRASAGSVGFLLVHREQNYFAFITAAHIFFSFQDLKQISEGHLHIPFSSSNVVQPSDLDNSLSPAINRRCGNIESIHFRKQNEDTLDRNCKDFVVVKSDQFRHPVGILQHPTVSNTSQQRSGCFGWPQNVDIQDGGQEIMSTARRIIKCGRTTELTRGEYVGPLFMARINDGNGTVCIFYHMMKIEGYGESEFAMPGDSGAPAFLKRGNNLNHFGIVTAKMYPFVTLAIPVTDLRSSLQQYDFQSFSAAAVDDGDQDDDDQGDDDPDDDDDLSSGTLQDNFNYSLEILPEIREFSSRTPGDPDEALYKRL